MQSLLDEKVSTTDLTFTTGKILVSDISSGIIDTSIVDATQLPLIANVTSDVQAQLDALTASMSSGGDLSRATYFRSLLAYRISFSALGEVQVSGTRQSASPVTAWWSTLSRANPSGTSPQLSNLVPANRMVTSNGGAPFYVDMYERVGFDYASLLIEGLDLSMNEFNMQGLSVVTYLRNTIAPSSNNSGNLFTLYSETEANELTRWQTLLVGSSFEGKLFNTSYQSPAMESRANRLMRQSLTSGTKSMFTDSVADIRGDAGPIFMAHVFSTKTDSNPTFGDILLPRGQYQLFYAREGLNEKDLNAMEFHDPSFVEASTSQSWARYGLRKMLAENSMIVFGTRGQQQENSFPGLSSSSWVSKQLGHTDQVENTNFTLGAVNIFNKALTYEELAYLAEFSDAELEAFLS